MLDLALIPSAAFHDWSADSFVLAPDEFGSGLRATRDSFKSAPSPPFPSAARQKEATSVQWTLDSRQATVCHVRSGQRR